MMNSTISPLNVLNKIMLLSFLMSQQFIAFPQQIDNVHSSQEGKTIIVTYDLSGLSSGQKATVNLYCSENGGTTWGNALLKVTGDVGAGITAGYGKRVVWDVLAERERFIGDRMVFEVRAMLALPRQPYEPEMVFIKGGTFQMGSIEGIVEEKPVHTVTLSDFYIGKYEVTQAQWQAVMGNNPSHFEGDNLPVENVSWDDVQQFLNKLNTKTGKQYRLPTEAEWEYACRAGTTTPFNTGNCINTSQANYNGIYPYTGCSKGEYKGKTMPVGGYIPNAWGLYDMHGNVWEWCSDWYGAYTGSLQNDPRGASSGSYRVIRGGSWLNFAQICRSAYRNFFTPDNRINILGFRLVSPM